LYLDYRPFTNTRRGAHGWFGDLKGNAAADAFR